LGRVLEKVKVILAQLSQEIPQPSQGAEENIWTKEGESGERSLNKEELHNLYASPLCWSSQVKEAEMGRVCRTHDRDEKHV